MQSNGFFPTTRSTWLFERIPVAGSPMHRSEQDLRDAREHVMRRYYEPLSAYISATSYRDIDAPAALVAGFFVDRLSDDSFFTAWRASGLPLRKWLVNGLLFWVRTEMRRRRRLLERESSWPLAGDHPERSVHAGGRPEVIFEREWARSIVTDACEVVASRLAAEGKSDRWHLFRLHVLDGLSFEQVARELACDLRDVRNACRTVRARLEVTMMDLLRAEGVRESELDAEIARIHSHFRSREGA